MKRVDAMYMHRMLISIFHYHFRHFIDTQSSCCLYHVHLWAFISVVPHWTDLCELWYWGFV